MATIALVLNFLKAHGAALLVAAVAAVLGLGVYYVVERFTAKPATTHAVAEQLNVHEAAWTITKVQPVDRDVDRVITVYKDRPTSSSPADGGTPDAGPCDVAEVITEHEHDKGGGSTTTTKTQETETEKLAVKDTSSGTAQPRWLVSLTYSTCNTVEADVNYRVLGPVWLVTGVGVRPLPGQPNEVVFRGGVGISF